MMRPWPYAIAGLIAAALAAGGLVGLEFATFGLVASLVEGSSPADVAQLGLFAAAIASVAFLVGLIFPGLVVWFFLHGIGQTSFRAATIAGATGASLTGLILTAPAAGWYAGMAVIQLALPGALAGWVLRRIAYGSVRPLPPPPPAPPSEA